MTETRAFNGLSPRDWTRLSRSVWTAREVSSARNAGHLEHGATFSVALAERAMQLYTDEHDLVLDPFVGVGTTLIAARSLNRKAIGIELYPRFSQIAEEALAQQTFGSTNDQHVVCGDCRCLETWVERDSVQLTLTSPPYADFIRRSVQDREKTHKKSRIAIDNRSVVKPYGHDIKDFGNLPYEEFVQHVASLMAKLFLVTRPGGYNVWVVKDCRDPQHGKPLVDMHSAIALTGQQAGFLYHDLIVWDQNEQRRLVLLGYPSAFYVNINHTFLVVLRRPKA